jgi:hypothetical protein
MKLFNKPLGEYCQFSKMGIYLLALVGVIRFLMKPVFNVPYAQGTYFTSMTTSRADGGLRRSRQYGGNELS